MVIEIINKLLMLLFFMSCLNALRHSYYFIQTWFSSTEEEPIKYMVKPMSLWMLGLSLGYVLTVIFTGLGI